MAEALLSLSAPDPKGAPQTPLLAFRMFLMLEQMGALFIGHSSKDNEQALRVLDWLKSEGGANSEYCVLRHSLVVPSDVGQPKPRETTDR